MKRLLTFLATLTLSTSTMASPMVGATMAMHAAAMSTVNKKPTQHLVVTGNGNEYVIPPVLQGHTPPSYDGPGRAIFCDLGEATYPMGDDDIPFYDCTGDTLNEDPEQPTEEWILYICNGGECYNRDYNLLFTMDADWDTFAALLHSTYELTWDDGLYIAVNPEWVGASGVPYPTFNDLVCTSDFSICTYEHKQYTVLELYSKGLVPAFNSSATMSDGSNLPDDTECMDGYCYDGHGNKVGLFID